MHLAENTLLMGPQRQFACFKEESKNCPVKRHVSTCNNFVNPPKTAMEQAQIHVASVWGTSNDFVEERVFVTKQKVPVNLLPVAPQLHALGFGGDDEPLFWCIMMVLSL